MGFYGMQELTESQVNHLVTVASTLAAVALGGVIAWWQAKAQHAREVEQTQREEEKRLCERLYLTQRAAFRVFIDERAYVDGEEPEQPDRAPVDELNMLVSLYFPELQEALVNLESKHRQLIDAKLGPDSEHEAPIPPEVIELYWEEYEEQALYFRGRIEAKIISDFH